MNKVVRSHRLLTLVPVCLLSAQAALAQETEETPRADKHYIGLLATAFNFRSIGSASNEQATGSGGTLIAGSHINDMFHAELRAGGGLRDAEVPSSDLTLSVDYFASWYIGLHYPVTDYANVYGQAGFSFIHGTAELENTDENQNAQFQDLEGDFPDSSFSISWVLGLDVKVMSDTYLVLEGGKLFEDTSTDANTFQFSAGLKYEF
ncbi:outer membrane beta-barrel protein [Marinobacter sp. 2_MG-2023]|uniref:outer membrane beta-barrel protein n=1 Tax=Marinobacter sp. 2_MG-2023 TaxID=3062679 RepID=UPI0026E2FABB|nr:outer membrane beta-barrel protein [Marinobacter sp. 2_MG-2023]MDO6442013.1 outer membrane beta-barrel protein [Marinobacter sp. 2_MG-2023]